MPASACFPPLPAQRSLVLAVLLCLVSVGVAAQIKDPVLTLDGLPRPATPAAESGPVVPERVIGWRREAQRNEHGDGIPRDPLRAAELYCRAARYGDAESQYSLAWMLTNSRGIERDDATAAHLFAAAAEQGFKQAQNMLKSMGTPRGAPPPCLRQPEADSAQAAAPSVPVQAAVAPPLPPIPSNAPAPIVNFVNIIAPEYKLEPRLVLAIMATESNFDPLALSPRNAQGLMQLIPGTAARFGVRDALDPAQNIRGGMAYLRWLMAFFEGDIVLVAAAYNAGERAVERYLGVPPYAETRNYVRKIQAAMGGRNRHAFDATVTPPSKQMVLLRRVAPGR
ncbi:MAG: transglycosylase SLT domain-containing protein [Rubrivivax sp.]